MIGGAPRVVVSGVGAVTAMGRTAGALWDGVKAGRVAIRPMSRPMQGLGTTVGAEVRGRVRPRHRYRRPADHREPAFEFALYAAEEAFHASRALSAGVPPERWGIVLGTCNAGLVSGEVWYVRRYIEERAEPELVLLVPPQALAEALSAAFDLKGPALSVNTACAAGANALGAAAEMIRSGQADAVLAGGSDALSDVLFAGFTSLESLSPQPAAPYSRTRQGLSLGEGSGMLVLIRDDIAARAELPVLAEVLGYGLSADGFHPTAPHPEGEGAARAIAAALESAGVAPDEVGYVNGHGTGTPKNDSAETAAIRAGLGPAADRVLVSSTKSQIGHLLGAAGAVEAIVTIKALQEQTAPPTANYEEADPECDLDYVPNVARAMRADVAITNNFAFGGANACVVLARAGARAPAPPAPRRERVVATGLSTLTSAGCDPDGVLDAVLKGTPTTTRVDGALLGRVDLDPSEFLSARDRRRIDRLGVLAIVAAKLALRDAGLEVGPHNRTRIGVVFGTGIGPMESMEQFVRPLIQEGFEAANPAVFPNTVYNAAAGLVAIHTGAVGPASTVTTGHAAGASAVAYGYDLLAAGRADAIICLAADALTDTVIESYRELGSFSDAAGFALAEAGAAIVLERHDAAAARGARMYGEVTGYAITSDARGVARFHSRGRGLERAMRAALDHAGRDRDDVATIWTGEMGLRGWDRAERTAIRRLFPAGTPTIASRLVLGEPVGAGGAIAAALAFKSWERRRDARPAVGTLTLVNGSSLGGTHVVLAVDESVPA